MCMFGSEAYWLELPVGLISKARGQRLTQDYITNLPQAAVLLPKHAAVQNPSSRAQIHAHFTTFRNLYDRFDKLQRLGNITGTGKVQI